MSKASVTSYLLTGSPSTEPNLLGMVMLGILQRRLGRGTQLCLKVSEKVYFVGDYLNKL